MTTKSRHIKLTPGGFPDLLADPVSPRTVACDFDSHSVINLSDDMTNRDDDDTLLDEILEDDGGSMLDDDQASQDDTNDGSYSDESYEEPPHKNLSKHHYEPKLAMPVAKRVAAASRRMTFYEEEKKEEDRVETLRNEFDQQAYHSMAHANDEEHYDDEEEYGSEEEESGDDDDESVRSNDSATTVDLLERAHDRLHMQQLHDEIDNLKNVIERKNVELENLTGQLRRAVATKCDLVLAHTELELHHEHNLRKREMGLKELGKVNRGLLEEQSMVEIELLNEIALLTAKMNEREDAHKKQIQDLEQQHNAAITNRERLHKSEVMLKNSQVAKLQEEIRVLKGGSPAAATLKKGGLLSFIPIQKQV